MDKLKQETSEVLETLNPLYRLTIDEHTRMLYEAMHKLEPSEYIAVVLHYIQGISFSLVANNFWLIRAKKFDFDPSEISTVSGEDGQFPGFRSFGLLLPTSTRWSRV